jgi:uncharacterized protein YutE (UPF0331/DUF86 family)
VTPEVLLRKLDYLRQLLADLAGRLQEAAGMRNVIVHLYQAIDYTVLRDSISPALRDFGQFIALFETRLDG